MPPIQIIAASTWRKRSASVTSILLFDDGTERGGVPGHEPAVGVVDPFS
jgi:hypothetical protein